MTSLASVGQLVAVIQSQLSARGGGAAAAPGAPAARGGARAAAGAAPTYAQEQLAALIAERVRLIGRDDPQRGRKAFRVFLEAVLLSHFGPALANDAQFYQMLDDVQNAMESDAAVRALVDSAIGHLLRQD